MHFCATVRSCDCWNCERGAGQLANMCLRFTNAHWTLVCATAERLPRTNLYSGGAVGGQTPAEQTSTYCWCPHACIQLVARGTRGTPVRETRTRVSTTGGSFTRLRVECWCVRSECGKEEALCSLAGMRCACVRRATNTTTTTVMCDWRRRRSTQVLQVHHITYTERTSTPTPPHKHPGYYY